MLDDKTLSEMTDEEKQFFTENYWLSGDDDGYLNTNIENPLLTRQRLEEDIENPLLYWLKIMRQPEYFSFTFQHIFNIEVPPFQMAIFRELWVRPFPMLIGSRGLGKSWLLAMYCMMRMFFCQGIKIVVVGSAFRQSKVIFEYCETIWNNAPLLREMFKDGKSGPRRDIDRCTLRLGDSIMVAIPLGDGCLTPGTLTTYGEHFGVIEEDALPYEEGGSIKKRDRVVYGNKKFSNSDEAYCNGVKPTKKIVTKRGYVIEGTHNHRIKILRGMDVVWERFDSILPGDHVLLDRSFRWHNGKFLCEEGQAYALGLMIGDGCWTDQYKLGYATQDKELIDAVRAGTGLSFSNKCDKHHFVHSCKQDRRDWMNFWGLKTSYAHEKVLPKSILSADRRCMSACLRGLFDTDGTLQVSHAKGGTSVSVGFCNTSETLVRQMQYILLHYGILSTISSRKRREEWKRCYELHITGVDAVKFAEHIGFGLTRKMQKLRDGINQKERNFGCSEGVPGIADILADNLPGHSYISSFRARKRISSDKIVGLLERNPDVDAKFASKARRLTDPDVYYDEVASITDGESITYDIHVPETHEYCANGFFSHNSKIRGLRANIIIADEFASISNEIFENVVSGFAVVSMSPIEKMKQASRLKAMRKLKQAGLAEKETQAIPGLNTNQTIISGTAYYSFNTFYHYWKRWKAIVESRGDTRKLEEIFGGDVPEKFNWKDFSVIRVPVNMLPEGYMDEKHISKAKATLHRSQYLMEFGAVFANDSNGFFKRSLIEHCVVGKTDKPIIHQESGEIIFSAALRGDPSRKYVLAVDPASEQDNFSIIVLELWGDHRRIVHCWTTTRKRHRAKVNKGLAKEQDFYNYCGRKIRDLIRLFPCERIALDSQGGGVAVFESLMDPANRIEGERPILPVIKEDEPGEFDNVPGLHILELVQFAKADWVSEANHGMRKDFEDRVLLFPMFDSAILGLAVEEDKILGRVQIGPEGEEKLYDTLEDCVMEIEELKDELASIVHSQTGTTMRDRWDTPEIKQAGGKKGRLRKDRYSALLMANMVARQMQRVAVTPRIAYMGGFANELIKNKEAAARHRPDWQNPEWYTLGTDVLQGVAVNRGRGSD